MRPRVSYSWHERVKAAGRYVGSFPSVLMSLTHDQNSPQRPIESAEYKQLSLPASIPSSSIRFLESVESGHSAHGIQARIGALLGVPENTSLRMDSQAKYGCLGRGEGGA
jgi:3'(2'), 5'-bisphosphate nucleotidase